MHDQQPWRNGGRGPTLGEIRRARRFIAAAILLACVTHLLISQWVSARPPMDPQDGAAVTVRLRDAADLVSRQVTLFDVCQLEWTAGEPATTDGLPIGETILANVSGDQAEVAVAIEQVLRVLADAGVKPQNIRIEGAIRCVVRIAAPATDEAGLLEWAGMDDEAGRLRGEQPSPTTRPAGGAGHDSVTAIPSTAWPAGEAAAWAEPDPSPASEEMVEFRSSPDSVGEQLRHDLARRLELPAESVQIAFGRDDLAFAYRTDIAARHIRAASADDLGPVAWIITLDGAQTRIHASASAVVTRAVAASALPAGRVIRPEDLATEQVRIARLEDRGMPPEAAVGQQTVGPWTAGEVLTPRRLAPWMLVREGELVTVRLVRNGIEIRVLAKALESGSFGQVIRATSDATDQELQVTMTAPQVGRLVQPELGEQDEPPPSQASGRD